MYKGQSGMWSWLFHRVSGLGVLLFLLIHIVDISLLNFGPKIYNEGIALFSLGIVRVLTLALIGGLLYHSFNGVRIILIDFWPGGARYQARMFAIVMALTIVCFLPAAYFVMGPVFGWPTGNMPAGM
jgi:succinate dehydrogenase / fumarate reductase cytochrome b subunit